MTDCSCLGDNDEAPTFGVTSPIRPSSAIFLFPLPDAGRLAAAMGFFTLRTACVLVILAPPCGTSSTPASSARMPLVARPSAEAERRRRRADEARSQSFATAGGGRSQSGGVGSVGSHAAAGNAAAGGEPGGGSGSGSCATGSLRAPTSMLKSCGAAKIPKWSISACHKMQGMVLKCWRTRLGPKLNARVQLEFVAMLSSGLEFVVPVPCHATQQE